MIHDTASSTKAALSPNLDANVFFIVRLFAYKSAGILTRMLFCFYAKLDFDLLYLVSITLSYCAVLEDGRFLTSLRLFLSRSEIMAPAVAEIQELKSKS